MIVERNLIVYARPDKPVAISQLAKSLLVQKNIKLKNAPERKFKYDLMGYRVSTESLSLYAILYKVFEGKRKVYEDSRYFSLKEANYFATMISGLINSFEPHQIHCLSCDESKSTEEMIKFIKIWKQSLK